MPAVIASQKSDATIQIHGERARAALSFLSKPVKCANACANCSAIVSTKICLPVSSAMKLGPAVTNYLSFVLAICKCFIMFTLANGGTGRHPIRKLLSQNTEQDRDGYSPLLSIGRYDIGNVNKSASKSLLSLNQDK